MKNVTPTGLVIHPGDAEEIDLTQDGNDRYYFAGPQASGASPIWSVPAVVTPAIAAGTAWLRDFAGSAAILSREEARLDFSEALGLKENTVTFRAELRMGFGILRRSRSWR
ncbi:MAG: phage major capsid protein [Actinomycetota bacterium]